MLTNVGDADHDYSDDNDAYRQLKMQQRHVKQKKPLMPQRLQLMVHIQLVGVVILNVIDVQRPLRPILLLLLLLRLINLIRVLTVMIN
jgi:hypothetical protein